jgi:hypothetical protein
VSQTTGPVLAIGGITIANRVLLNDRPWEWKTPVATGIAALAFGLAEKAWPTGAKALAWMALVAVVITRVDPAVPSPVESLNAWWRTQ